MLFSSPTFVFAFLPLLLALHALTPKSLRNGLLLAASLVFYWWGEPVASALMVASILFNRCRDPPPAPCRPAARRPS